MALSDTEYERKYGGSQLFEKTNAATLAANEVFNVSFDRESADFPTAAKYGAMDTLLIRHGSTPGSDTRIKIFINGSDVVRSVISPGEIRQFDKRSIPAFRTLQIKNAGATTIAIGDIEVIAQKDAVEADDVFRQAHESFIKKRQTRVQGEL